LIIFGILNRLFLEPEITRISDRIFCCLTKEEEEVYDKWLHSEEIKTTSKRAG
jgi:hypothetical protein